MNSDKSIHRCFFIPDSSYLSRDHTRFFSWFIFLSNYTVYAKQREIIFSQFFRIRLTHNENIPFSLDQSKFDLRSSVVIDVFPFQRIKSIPRNHCHLHCPTFFDCKTTIRDTCPDLAFICLSLRHLYFTKKTNSVWFVQRICRNCVKGTHVVRLFSSVVKLAKENSNGRWTKEKKNKSNRNLNGFRVRFNWKLFNVIDMFWFLDKMKKKDKWTRDEMRGDTHRRRCT